LSYTVKYHYTAVTKNFYLLPALRLRTAQYVFAKRRRGRRLEHPNMELLERSSQLQALNSALSQVRAREGEGCVALVYGEAGIGKTSLIEHFIKGHKHSWRVLQGACDSLFTPRPLGPLYDIALQLSGNLLNLLDSESNRTAIFSACLNELKEQKTILVIEDVHWADEATLDLLKYLGRRIRQTVSLMILTYRDDEIGADHPVQILLGDLASSQALHRIPVSPLSKDAVHELAKNKRVDSFELHRLTNGNPFFVTEVLAVESGIPETVRDAVLARAARLSSSARGVLEAAAVIGSRVEPWLLSNIAGAESIYVEECIARGMLQSQVEYYAFRHELARQTILDSISLQRKIALHRLALNALKESPETRDDLARLANHAEGTKDAEAVLEYAAATARQASAASSHREAAALYKLALRFSDGLLPAERAELLEAYADESGTISQIGEEITARRKALEIWRNLGNLLKQGENLAHLSHIFVMNGRNTEAEQASRAAIEMLEALPATAQLALAYSIQANQRMLNLDFTEAVQWGEKAIALAERFEDKANLRATYTTVGAALIFTDFDNGRTTLEYNLSLARESGLERSIVGALQVFANACCQVYQFVLADRYLSEGLAFAVERDLDYSCLFLLATQALSHLYQGRWNECVVSASSVLQRHGANAVTRAIALVVLARLRARRGDPEVMTVLDEALELTPPTDSLMRLGRIWAARVEALWLADHYEQALEEASAAFDVAVGKQHAWFTGEMAFWQWRMGKQVSLPPWTAKPFALQIAGDWHGAAEEWKERGCPYEQAMALTDGDEAAQLVALEIFERLGARPIMEKLKQKMRAQGISIPRGPRAATRENPHGLTAREMEVVALIAQGKSNREIAIVMTVGEKTIETYVTRILNKLNFESRVQIATWAIEKGLSSSTSKK
jgi:DNA-binding CsgD family transcriptional regulator/tetratricopeptide (TPR) repeat protein